jgi:hypothetical protein
MGEFFEALKRGEFVNPHPRTATPPKVRTIDGKRYYLAVYDLITTKKRAQLAKPIIKTGLSRPYRVRILGWRHAYCLYTRPMMTNDDEWRLIMALPSPPGPRENVHMKNER